MPKAIVDTDILSEVFSGVDPRVMANATLYVAKHGVLTFTSVTLYEVVTGLEQNQAQGKLARLKELLSQNEEIVPASVVSH